MPIAKGNGAFVAPFPLVKSVCRQDDGSLSVEMTKAAPIWL
ncbi:hypothetical protein [Mesorhizobium sp. M0460]